MSQLLRDTLLLGRGAFPRRARPLLSKSRGCPLWTGATLGMVRQRASQKHPMGAGQSRYRMQMGRCQRLALAEALGGRCQHGPALEGVASMTWCCEVLAAEVLVLGSLSDLSDPEDVWAAADCALHSTGTGQFKAATSGVCPCTDGLSTRLCEQAQLLVSLVPLQARLTCTTQQSRRQRMKSSEAAFNRPSDCFSWPVDFNVQLEQVQPASRILVPELEDFYEAQAGFACWAKLAR